MTLEALTRTERMIEAAPSYYQYSNIFYEIQKAQGEEYNSQEAADLDLRLQIRVATATWGLKYWEEMLGLPIEEGTLELRRSKVLAMLRSGAPFSSSMLASVVNAYTKNPVEVTIDVTDDQLYVITVHEFVTQTSLFAQVDNIIHAHLGIEYRAEWIYPSNLEYHVEYKPYNYPFPIIAGDYTTGTGPAGYSTLGRIYENELTLEDQYSNNFKDYNFSSENFLCGTGVV
jgi:hypothetical protein